MFAFVHLLLGSFLIFLGLYNLGISLFSVVCFAVSYQLLAYAIGYLIRDELRK